MLRYLRAMAWLRWRVMLNSAKPSQRRDTFEQLSRLGAVLAPALMALTLIPGAIVLGTLGYFGGLSMARDPYYVDIVTAIARGLIALSFFAVLLAPLIRTIQGAHIGLTRLMLLPIPRRALHFSEYTAGLTDPWVGVFVPAVLIIPVGLLVGGEVFAALISGTAAVMVLATLAGAGSLFGMTALLVFRDRRRAELVTLVVFLLISMIGFVPIMVERAIDPDDPGVVEETGDPPTADPAPTAVDAETREDPIAKIDRALIWVRWFPSELYGFAVARSVEGQTTEALGYLLGLTAIAGMLYAASLRVYGRLIETPEGGSGGGAATRANFGTSSLPWTRPATSAMALAVYRTSLRTVRGKMAVYFTPAVIALTWLLVGTELSGKYEDTEIGPFLFLFGVAISFISLQPMLHNQFAVDGAGLTLQFLVPTTTRQIAAAKVLGNALLGAIPLALCFVMAAVLTRSGHPGYWIAMLLVGVGGFVLLAPICSLLSAVLPKSADLSRMGKAGNPHPIAGIAGVLLTPICLAPPFVLFLIGMLLGSPPLSVGLTALWAALSVAMARPLVRAAGDLVSRRRENLLLVASGR